MLIQILSGMMVSMCFAILFYTDKRHLFYCAIGGGIASAIYFFILETGGGLYMANFLAAIGFAIYAECMARIQKTTVTTYAICALIPLVPGAGMYYTMLHIVNNELELALFKGIETLSCACLLALGILFVSTFGKLLKQKKTKKQES